MKDVVHYILLCAHTKPNYENTQKPIMKTIQQKFPFMFFFFLVFLFSVQTIKIYITQASMGSVLYQGQPTSHT